MASVRYGRMRLWFNACGVLFRKLRKLGKSGFTLMADPLAFEREMNSICLSETYSGRLNFEPRKPDKKNTLPKKIYMITNACQTKCFLFPAIIQANNAGINNKKTKFRIRNMINNPPIMNKALFILTRFSRM